MSENIPKSLVYPLFLLFGLTLPLGVLLARTESSNYIIFADVISSGGAATSTSDSYSLADTIGEAMILSATSTSASYGIKAGFQELYPDQFLSFSISNTAISLGTLSRTQTKTNSHTMTLATNATNGFLVTVSGSTLSSGGNTISAIGSSAAAASIGNEQFGINLVANSTPSIGANPSGTAPIGSAAAQYNTANFFAFNSGATVASSAGNINQTIFTVSYIANIASGTEAGTYATTLTYSATANF